MLSTSLQLVALRIGLAVAKGIILVTDKQDLFRDLTVFEKLPMGTPRQHRCPSVLIAALFMQKRRRTLFKKRCHALTLIMGLEHHVKFAAFETYAVG